MNLQEAKKTPLKQKKKKRLGRGVGSGLGKTCGKGSKGQRSRSGGGTRLGFEGGQMSIVRRLPKKGFNNPFREEYLVINVGSLNHLEDGAIIDPPKARNLGLMKGGVGKLKILGKGTLDKKLTVKAHRFSKQAREKIQKAGGEAEEI